MNETLEKAEPGMCGCPRVLYVDDEEDREWSFLGIREVWLGGGRHVSFLFSFAGKLFYQSRLIIFLVKNKWAVRLEWMESFPCTLDLGTDHRSARTNIMNYSWIVTEEIPTRILDFCTNQTMIRNKLRIYGKIKGSKWTCKFNHATALRSSGEK